MIKRYLSYSYRFDGENPRFIVSTDLFARAENSGPCFGFASRAIPALSKPGCHDSPGRAEWLAW
jgi:hypothetical protein